jgi:hypothetical protein
MSNIQQIMKYFSSILGLLLMLVVPCVLVFTYRKKYKKSQLENGKLNLSFLQGNKWLVFLGILTLCLFGLIVYGFVHNDDITCVAQE